MSDVSGVGDDPRLHSICAAHPHDLVFATISGAHLYGFASRDSDYDLRGIHVLPLRQVISLSRGRETIERMEDTEGLELDLVTHDIAKFMRLMLRPNGYVLEQLYSPLVVRTSPEHEELMALGKACITRHHVRHYLGFAANQWRLFEKEQPPRVKPLLYVFRVLLSGIHLMRTGEVVANLVELNDREFRLPFIEPLVRRKVEGAEGERLEEAELDRYRREFASLEETLRRAGETSSLPDAPAARDAMSDLLVRVRMAANG